MMPYEKCIYLNNRGNSYYFRKDYPHALEMFRKELAFARSYPDMAFEVHLSEMNLGETFLLMNQTDSAASIWLSVKISSGLSETSVRSIIWIHN